MTDRAIAQAVSIIAPLFLVGQNGFVVFGAIPAVLRHAPTSGVAAKQWRTIMEAGHKTGPACAILGALSAGYVAWQSRRISDVRVMIANEQLRYIKFSIRHVYRIGGPAVQHCAMDDYDDIPGQ